MFGKLWRKYQRRDDTGSMPVALLVTLLSVTLSAGMSGMVVNQIKDSKRLELRTSAVAAAQAGLDAGLAKIRSAFVVDGTGQHGQLDMLPCTALGNGTAYAAGTNQSYSTSIGYFVVDPSSLVETLKPVGDLGNLSALVPSSNPASTLLGQVGSTVSLATGGVVKITDSLASALTSTIKCVGGVVQNPPLFGLLRSTGTVSGVTRTLYATYKFRTNDDTIPGGKIVINNGAGVKLCLGTNLDLSKPAIAKSMVGKPVMAVDCTSEAAQVTLIYPKNLSLGLSKTRTTAFTGTAAYPYGLCIAAPAVLVAAGAVTWAACGPDGTVTTGIVNQQWAYNVNAQTYYAATLSGLNRVQSAYCLTMSTPGVINTPIVVRNTTCGTSNQVGKSFVPENEVGAGGASLTSGQYVNKDEYGRCLDLTNESPTATSHGTHPVGLISYPCKQTLSGDVYWNHKWTGPLTLDMISKNVNMAQGLIYTTQPTTPAKNWCMKSPGVELGFVWVAACNAAAADQQWYVYGASPNINQAYQVIDKSTGFCLEAGGDRGTYYQFSGWSYIIVAKCNGSAQQKWNAPTDWNLAPLKSIQEK